MNWFEKLMPSRIRTEANDAGNHDVCPKCHHHMRMNARRRLENFLDEEPREEIAESLKHG